MEFKLSPRPAPGGSNAAAAPASLTPKAAPPSPLQDITAAGRGVATASPSGADAGALFDDTSGTEAVFSGEASITYALAKAGGAPVGFYTLTSGAAGGQPSGWRLEGSDDGQRWTVLDRREGERFEWARYTRPFRLQSPASYRHYRLVVTAASAARWSLAEIELLGASARR